MNRSSLILFLTLFTYLHNQSFAEVMIIGTEIPGLHERDRTGAYDKIIVETVINSQLATLQIYPPLRADKNFSQCHNCCVSPSNTSAEFYDFNGIYMQTDPLNIAKCYIFVNKGQPMINRLEDLQNKTVGVRFGMPYGKHFEQAKLSTLKVRKLKSHISLMQKGRIDAFLAFAPDVYQMFRELNLEPFPHDTSQPIAVHPDRLVCKGVKAEFINTFNKQLRTLKNDGRLQRILEDVYVGEYDKNDN